MRWVPALKTQGSARRRSALLLWSDTIDCVAPGFAIPNPCSKRWADLTGDDRKRFCPDCRTFVHAVEQCSADEIAALKGGTTGRLCGYLAGESLPPPRSRREVLVGVALTAISPLMAQTGRVRIRVTDSSGTLKIPEAEASLMGKDDKPTLTAHANEAGEIVLSGLPIGDSRISVSCQGFNSLPLTVTIRNADELKIDAMLQLGSVGTVVNVEPVAPQPPHEVEAPLPPSRTIALPPPPADAPSAVSPNKKARKGWWIFRGGVHEKGPA